MNDIDQASYKIARLVLIVSVSSIVAMCLLAFVAGRLAASDKTDLVPPGLLLIRSCQLHDLDTLVKCDILLA